MGEIPSRSSGVTPALVRFALRLPAVHLHERPRLGLGLAFIVGAPTPHLLPHPARRRASPPPHHTTLTPLHSAIRIAFP